MLFSAGLGIALIFYCVAESIMHFLNPPDNVGCVALVSSPRPMKCIAIWMKISGCSFFRGKRS
ncbi:BCCT family transporter [Cobetia sp. UIB-001]|uniref:BCCT family transporter n=1 Tax=Cobetia sp. UIB-001 TaxID=2717697 RepID=UPI00384B0A0A